MINAPKTNYFVRPTTHYMNLLEKIVEAYTAFGLNPPTRASEIRRLVEAGAQSTRQVADQMARDAFLNDDDPEEWYAAALDRIKEAQARETLAKVFADGYSQNVQNASRNLVAPAGDDLAAPVAKAVKKLVDAAKKLPQGLDALDTEANLAADTGSHLYTVRAELAHLSTATGIYDPLAGSQEISDQGLRNIIPLVKFPTAAVEIIENSFGENPRTLNEHELEGTRTIRKIAEDIRHHGTDIVLVMIAQGHYPNTEISFAGRDEFGARIRNVATTYKRTRATGSTKQFVL